MITLCWKSRGYNTGPIATVPGSMAGTKTLKKIDHRITCQSQYIHKGNRISTWILSLLELFMIAKN